MSAIDVQSDPGFGLRPETGVTPTSPPPVTDGGDALWGAAFRQTNSFVSAMQYLRNSGQYAPVPGYNPLTDVKGWGEPSYFLDHGTSFVGSQSPAETQSIKAQIDQETSDQRLLSANGKAGFIASTVAGMLDPTVLLPGGVAVDAAKGGLTFTKAAVNLGKAGFMQSVSQEALLHATQQTRTFEESALNVGSATLLTALIGGGAAAVLGRDAPRVAALLDRDRYAIDAHAGNSEPRFNGELAKSLAPLFDDVGMGSVPAFDRSTVSEGQLRSPDEIPAYVRDVVKNANDKSALPRFDFDLGPVPPNTADALRSVDPAIGEAAAHGVSVSSHVVDKLYRKNPAEGDRLLRNLPDLLANSEAIADSRASNRVILAARFETESGASGRNAAAVMEVSRTRRGAEVVTIHVVPDRTLAKIREENGAGGAALPHSAGPVSEAPAAAASTSDFPSVSTVDRNIGQSGGGFNPGDAAINDHAGPSNSEARQSFVFEPDEWGTERPGERSYSIKNQAGEEIAALSMKIDGDTARIVDIYAPGGGKNALGNSIVRGILRQFQADHPEIKTISGERVTGGKVGGGSVYEGHGVETTVGLPAGTGRAASGGAAASDTRKIELVDFGLNQIPGVRKVVEKTSPMQRLFGSGSVSARRATADLAETSLLTKENLEGGVTTVGPALDREARLLIHQGQVAIGDELSTQFSEYRFGEQRTAPRARALAGDALNRFGMAGDNLEPKMSFDEFKEAVSDALRNGDKHEIPQVQTAAQTIRNKVFDPWKERAIKAGLLPEDVGVATSDSYFQRLYNKQAIAARRPEFVDRVTDWLQAEQSAKAQAQQKIGLYQGALQVASEQIENIQSRIAKLEADADVIAARQEETTRINKAANQRARKMREGADQENLPLQSARGGAVFETLARNRGNLLADRASAKLAEIESLEQKLVAETANHDAMRAKIEDEIARWEGKSTAEAKAALKARSAAEQERQAKIDAGTSKGKGERLSSADKAVDRAVKRILESDRDLSRDELRSRAQEITDRIIGSPDGRLPYDLGMEHGTGGFAGGEQPRGPLAAREFNIPDKTIADFLENDVEHVVAAHLRTMVPDVLLTEKFGDTAMTEAFRKINDEYAAMIDAAKSEKERSRLETERQGVIADLAAVRDRVRGTYGMSSSEPMRNAARAANVLKNYNVLTSMGSAALSSLPDMAGSVMRHGLTSTFKDSWVPFFQFLTRQSDVWTSAAREYRAMGIAVESVLASRHHALTDTLDTYHPQSRLERTMQWATGKFQFVNLLAPWTDFAKINASMVAGSEILRAVKAASEGTATARQLRTLGESGIESHMAGRIAKAFEDGGEIRDGVHLPNTADWTDTEARRVFEGAVARDADIAVVTPGQEKPLWMSHQLLSVLGQFKSFTAAATERVLISNLQRRDAQVLQGMIFSMGLGMLSYKLNSLTGGQSVSDRPQDWIKEAISRGNLLGWFEEGNALASKVTRGGVDVYRVLGADKPLSRYASRSAMDQLLGPTAGKIGGILSVGSALSKPSEWNEADSKALRRLVAGQNVFYLRRLFDQVEQSGNNAFGIEMKGKPENR